MILCPSLVFEISLNAFFNLSWNFLSISGLTEIVSFGMASVSFKILVSLNTSGWSFLTILRASLNTAAASTSPFNNEMIAWSWPLTFTIFISLVALIPASSFNVANGNV